jgi:hypothetical protein
LLQAAGIPGPDAGLVLAGKNAKRGLADFIEAAAMRHWERETDPPKV